MYVQIKITRKDEPDGTAIIRFMERNENLPLHDDVSNNINYNPKVKRQIDLLLKPKVGELIDVYVKDKSGDFVLLMDCTTEEA